MHFQDKSGKVCFLVHPLIPLIIITLQNYFDQNFYLEKMFPGICNKIHSHLKFLSCPPSISLGGSRMSSIFVSTDSFFKNFEYIYIFFSTQGVFLKIFGQFDLFLRPVYIYIYIYIYIHTLKGFLNVIYGIYFLE